MRKTIFALAASAIMISCNNNTNPFLEEWTTPFGVPPFDKIQVEDYLPAVKEGIARQQAEIDAIVSNPQAPDFTNTIEAFQRSGELLSKVSGVLFNLSESDGTPELLAVVEEALPLTTAHSDNIYMNAGLFARVKAIYDGRDTLGLDAEQTAVLEKMYKNFVRNGIALDSGAQERMKQINARTAELMQKFGNNMLAQTNDFSLVLESEDELAGLPDPVRKAAAEAAKAAGMEGKYLFGLQNASYIPFMTYSSNRDLREKMFRAYSSRGNNGDSCDNKNVILEIMKLRIEKANLLGYDTPAAFILDNTMAKTPEAVDTFLEGIFGYARARALDELSQMQAIADREGAGFSIQAWDWAYYAEKLRKEKYALDENETKPYFRMENVRSGVFALASDLYGLQFEKADLPVYNPEAEAFLVKDSDGSLLGILYTDYFPRSIKRGGAWMTNFREQQVVDGIDIRPVIVNVGNFTKPTSDTPSLLTLDEVSTMFHEFGHALHGLLTKCRYPMVSGTAVARDFVELPSQINENWAFHPDLLAKYAFHYETGEPIPAELVEKINNASTFNQGFMATELAAAAILDMKWHELTTTDGIDVESFEKAAMQQIGLPEQIIPRYRSTYFNHIFGGGYSAGYYSYLWAEVLDKDAFELFRERGVFDKETAMSFRNNILAKGGSEDPMTLYRRFRGADPDPDAMLRARGLK